MPKPSDLASARRVSPRPTNRHVGAVRPQRERHEQPEPAGADDGACRRGRDGNLLEHAAGGGQRFDQHRGLVIHAVRNAVKVGGGQRQKLRERAVASDDTEHGPAIAVAAPRDAAALRTCRIRPDLPGDAPANPRGVRGRRVLDHADELVPRHAGNPA